MTLHNSHELERDSWCIINKDVTKRWRCVGGFKYPYTHKNLSHTDSTAGMEVVCHIVLSGLSISELVYYFKPISFLMLDKFMHVVPISSIELVLTISAHINNLPVNPAVNYQHQLVNLTSAPLTGINKQSGSFMSAPQRLRPFRQSECSISMTSLQGGSQWCMWSI